MRRTCKICGKEFDANSPKSCYCSDECRRKGEKLVRKAWEMKVGWKEKDAARHRAKTAAACKARIEKNEQEREKIRQDFTKKQKELDAAFESKCQAGDKSALTLKALQEGGNRSTEYWKCYAKKIIEYYENIGKTCSVTVNSISVYDECFPELVLQSLNEYGCFMISDR